MVFYNINALPKFENTVITIGSFDGVHHGHKAILEKVVAETKAIQGESILITFEPHPRKIIHPDESLGLLTSPADKTALLQAEGIDHIVFVPFTRDFSMLSAEEYIHDFLLKMFNPSKIIIGYDHKFGHSREGDIHLLRKLVPSHVSIIEIEQQLVDNAGVSSTKIRKALMDGDVIAAAHMLDRHYSYEGTVVKGDGIGRKFGYPTANIKANYSDILIPGIGVYAVLLTVDGVEYKGMMSIGVRPTINDKNIVSVEVNIFDFSDVIYGKTVKVTFIKRTRGEKKFDSFNDLIEAIKQDEIEIRAVLANY